MRNIVTVKFSTNRYLAEILLATGEAQLEEGNNWGDAFWGTVDGYGENHLGKILMDLRESFKGIDLNSLEKEAAYHYAKYSHPLVYK